jgi:hypothetical protein
MPSSKKVHPHTTGLLMAKFTAFPVVNPSIGNSSQLQLMMQLTWASSILFCYESFYSLFRSYQNNKRFNFPGIFFLIFIRILEKSILNLQLITLILKNDKCQFFL